MKLGEKQKLFTLLQARLVIWVYAQGYMLTDGDAYRDRRVFGKIGVKKGYGRRNSNHKVRLARDYNLFKLVNGRWVFQRSTKAHAFIGKKWESMHDLAAWGGHWGDGNHYSFKHNGRR